MQTMVDGEGCSLPDARSIWKDCRNRGKRGGADFRRIQVLTVKRLSVGSKGGLRGRRKNYFVRVEHQHYRCEMAPPQNTIP